jgi:hypothetical protein
MRCFIVASQGELAVATAVQGKKPGALSNGYRMLPTRFAHRDAIQLQFAGCNLSTQIGLSQSQPQKCTIVSRSELYSQRVVVF